MAKINSFPNNQDEYVGAEYVMKWFHGRTSGVYGADGNCSASAVQGAMALDLSDGVGWISNDNRDGVVWWIDNEKKTGAKLRLYPDVADGVLNRIDRVVVSWETTNYVALPTVTILKGVPASNPVPPALTNNSTLRQISLHRLNITAGSLELTNAMITDERLDPDVCGIVTESVTVDTSGINERVNSTLDELQERADETLTDTQERATAVLTAIEQELADIESGTGVELKKLQFNEVVVPSESFSIGGISENFPYRAAVNLTGVLSSMIPEVFFGDEDAESGNFSTVAETYSGGVYIKAASPPETDVTIPIIICWRGNE